MSSLRQAAQQALEALNEAANVLTWDGFEAAAEALRAALAEPEQESVEGEPLPCPFCGHIGLDFSDGSTYRWGLASCSGCGATCGEIRREYPDTGKWHSEAIAEWNRRYTAPTPRKPLTDEEIALMYDDLPTSEARMIDFARAIEKAHGIGEKT